MKRINFKKLFCFISFLFILSCIIFYGTRFLKLYIENKREKSKEVYKMLGLTENEADFDNILNIHLLDNHKVEKGNALFPRLDVAKESEYIKSLMGGKN